MPRKSDKSAPPREKQIPEPQLDIPISFDPNGRPVTLREAMSPGYPPVPSFGALTPAQQTDLTIRRLEAQPDFEMAMIGAGIVHRQRAVEEVRAHSEVGEILLEIEHRIVDKLLAEIRK